MPRPPLPRAPFASRPAGLVPARTRMATGTILDRLDAEYWRGRDPRSLGGSPVAVAGMQLRGPTGWPVALQTLRDNYPPDVARAAWAALLAEPGSGWEVPDGAGGWVAYCLPGYDPLCGDDLTRASCAPAGRASTPRATVLPSPLPAKPWRVPDGLSACQRLLGLTAISDAGVSDPTLRREVARLVAQADAAMDRADIRDANERRKARAKLVLAYMQARGYRTDPPGQNWWQPVAWTLAHGGTCEALSAATRAGMILAGVPVEMVWIDQPGARLNHASCHVWYDDAWQWADASVPAALGENPYVVAALDDAGTDTRGDGLG